MRITAITFGAGWLAIIGFPLLSGFWSKDKIIEAAFVGEGWRPWVFGSVTMLAAGLTAFYMSRLFFMTFAGRERWTDDAHPHESSLLMTVPMVVLAVGSVLLGGVLTLVGFTHWLEPVVGAHGEEHPVLPVPVITGATLLLVAVGVLLAWRQYWREDVPQTAPRGSFATRAARADLFQEVVNASVFERPGLYLTRTVVFVDGSGVDGSFRGVGGLVTGFGGWLRKFQNGFVRTYAATMVIGVVVVLGSILVVR